MPVRKIEDAAGEKEETTKKIPRLWWATPAASECP
jgi:hypothetical protein